MASRFPLWIGGCGPGWGEGRQKVRVVRGGLLDGWEGSRGHRWGLLGLGRREEEQGGGTMSVGGCLSFDGVYVPVRVPV